MATIKRIKNEEPRDNPQIAQIPANYDSGKKSASIRAICGQKNRPVGPQNPSVGQTNEPVVPRNRVVVPRNPPVGPTNRAVASINRAVGRRNAPVVSKNDHVTSTNRPVVSKNRPVGRTNRAVGQINPTFSGVYEESQRRTPKVCRRGVVKSGNCDTQLRRVSLKVELTRSAK